MINNRQKLKEILIKLHCASAQELPKVKQEAEKYFAGVDAKELALAEQELIQEGTGRQEMKRLCDVHLEVMKKQMGASAEPIKLASWHPIQICLDEHEVIKGNLQKLKDTYEELKKRGSFAAAKVEIGTLKELAHFFVETEKHHKREEEALFPRLEAHGITEPPQIFREDHVEFLARKREFYNLITSDLSGRPFAEFVKAIGEIVEFLFKNLGDHIYKEDNILYPMALKTLEESEWKDVRKKFDAIGYCCFAPEDIKKYKREG